MIILNIILYIIVSIKINHYIIVITYFAAFSDVISAVKIPVLVGSGVTKCNACDYLSASGIIIGSHLKVSGQWDGELDADKTRDFMKHVVSLRDQTMDFNLKKNDTGSKKERFHSIDYEGA